MKFGIITATYNRPDLLLRAVRSLVENDYQDWMLAIVNDGSEADYSEIEQQLGDPRIQYIKLEQNRGCNYARNLALQTLLDAHCDVITFFDDDEVLEPDALSQVHAVIEENAEYGWFVCNSDYGLEDSITEAKEFDYVDDYLYGEALNGEKTHFWRAETIGKARFWEIVKNGEEWMFLLQLAPKTKIWGFPYQAKQGRYLEAGLTSAGIYKKFSPVIYFMEQAKPTLALKQKPGNSRVRQDFWHQTRQLPSRLVKVLLFYLRLYDPNKGIRQKKVTAPAGKS